ncbi:MAG: heme-binding protein [Natrialbaceae archaeon]|nr:heme-binding protein [Natrialbaceae archaeon]
MSRREPPQTDEGWYVLHDFRTVDWDAWRDAPERQQSRAIEAGTEFLNDAEQVGDAGAGASAAFGIIGNEADLLFLHLRPTATALEDLSRAFEQTPFAEFTDRTDSYLSVTEVSGYVSQEYFEADGEPDPGIESYIETRLHPSIPDASYVSFYPMDKRRDPENNWYDLPFDERAAHLEAHGEIGRDDAGRVSQVISSSVGLDDHEWGVTLFANELTDVKDLLYEMRFDPSTSRFAEFGQFLVGRRLDPGDLGAYMAGASLDEADRSTASPHGDDEDVRDDLREQGIYAGQPHGEDVHAIVLYSTADAGDLFEAVDDLRTNFDHYDTHVKTAVYEATDEGDTAVASLWETERAAETAAGFLTDLPDVVEPENDGWGTMGMFYTVTPAHREDFIDTFDQVGAALADMDGHRETTLLANREDENDMFIASNWDSREDAMAFFRSDAFADTVEWGRDILADRPRHVFLH